MKRGLLIAGGTLGGLGAVMSITPPQFSTTNALSNSGVGAISSGAVSGASSPATSSAVSTNAAAKPTQSATKAAATKAAVTKASPTTAVKATHSATKAATKSTSNSNANTGNAATNPTPAAAATTAASAGVSGTFTGPSVFVQYGNVQVQITVVNGRITDAQAIVAPTGKSARYTNMAVPILTRETLAAQSSNIQGASGASYTSYGWFKSLQGALANAGL